MCFFALVFLIVLLTGECFHWTTPNTGKTEESTLLQCLYHLMESLSPIVVRAAAN